MEAGRLTADLSLSLQSSTSDPPVSSSAVKQNTCGGPAHSLSHSRDTFSLLGYLVFLSVLDHPTFFVTSHFYVLPPNT